MKLIRLQIEKLFDIFDYDIPIENKDNLLIITGPNGFGKTKILNIIYHFFRKEFEYFENLEFKKIILSFNPQNIVEITKIENEIKITVNTDTIKGEGFIYGHFNKNIKEIFEEIEISIRKLRGNKWIASSLDNLEDKLYFENIEDLTKSYKNLFSELLWNKLVKLIEQNAVLEHISTELSGVHIIKEQRLQTEIYTNTGEDESIEVIETIEHIAKHLRNNINKTFKRWLVVSQKLDSTFPKRLLNEKQNLSKEDFDNRFRQLAEKQSLLKSYDLQETEQEVPDYDEENAKVLSIYLKDSEEKFSVFDILLKQLHLFTTILNERRFTFKHIKIDKNKGFYFETLSGKQLKLADLSSGEQHEVILLYELIFNAKENMMILIDEPEISLHVTWQKEFVSDLLKIMELQKVQVVIATHSPQIISNRWDLVYNLEKRD